MKTIEEIKVEIERLDKLRIKYISERDSAETECERDVAHELVLVYAMQGEKLKWVLKDTKDENS